MPSLRHSKYLGLWLIALWTALLLAQQDPPSGKTAASTAGRNAFNSSCAGCHGLDGRGSDKAIDIVTDEGVQRLSDERIFSVISKGLPGTGMPAFHNLSEAQIRAIVAYLRTLQGNGEARTLPGDAERGKGVFFGKGECSTCHMVGGQGGFLGPDLSSLGSTAPSDTILEEIVRSTRIPARGYRPVVLTTSAGERLEGVIRNEDNFSVQLQTKDGRFVLLQRSDLQEFERLDRSLMPTNYRDRLSPDELNDLVSFLMKAAPEGDKAKTSHKNEEPAE